MNLAERLRAVVRAGGSASQDPPYVPNPNAVAALGTPRRPGAAAPGFTSADPAITDDIADTLGGKWRAARGQRYLVVDRTYPTSHRLGRVAVGDCLPASDGLWRQLDLLMCGASSAGTLRERLVFVDLETTGLAGGAGTYAFLVGCGWFEGDAFRVRQFFLTSYAAERGLLEDVADNMGAAGALVTYNGKTFDLPLIETRFLFHRMAAPFSGLPHLDMLHAARRLWGPAEPAAASAAPANMRRSSCRLAMVEQAVLGHVREGDVPGFEIPSRYFHYVRSGDARPLEGVLEHNRLDLLALAMVTAKAASLLGEGAAGARTAREALGLGRLYERGGLIAEARACYARVGGVGPAVAFALSEFRRAQEVGRYDSESIPVDALTRAEALRAFALLCRRSRQYEEAAGAWRRVLTLRGIPAQIAQEATEALAIHHEHRLRDLLAARQFAMQTLQFNIGRTRLQAVHHRLARLDRKLGGQPTLLGLLSR